MALRPLLVPTLLLVLLVGAGCGEAASPAAGPPERPTAVPAADGLVRTGGPMLVLDDGDGPELCFGAADSMPPQCSGPAMLEWDWADHAGHFEEASGVRWGAFAVTGAFDGSAFAATEAVPEEEWEGSWEEHEPAGTPCEAPEGGWAVLDPATTSQSARQRTFRVAERLDGYAAAWVDQSINPAWPAFQEGDFDPEVMDALNDPAYTIVNVAVTRDPAAAESELRRTWGGPLCVSRAENTHARLKEVAEDLGELPGMLGAGYGTVGNRVEVTLLHDDGSMQRWADAEYGKDVVEVTSALVAAG